MRDRLVDSLALELVARNRKDPTVFFFLFSFHVFPSFDHSLSLRHFPVEDIYYFTLPRWNIRGTHCKRNHPELGE